ncbi:MAG: hypothetical protein ACRDUV_20270, partial [Pseudonocardiaceae bacterium]
RCAPLVHANARSGRIIPRVPDGSCPESDDRVGSASDAQRSTLAGLSPSRVREWLPGTFAARLLRGVMLPGGRIVDETDRVVHLFALPTERTIPDELPAFCGLAIRPGWAELVAVGTGMPCVVCVLAAPDPGAP